MDRVEAKVDRPDDKLSLLKESSSIMRVIVNRIDSRLDQQIEKTDKVNVLS